MKFIYLDKSDTNVTVLTFNSSLINSTKLPKIDSYLPSIKHSDNGCLTLILVSSLTNLPVEIKSLTKSILTSISSLINSLLALGKSAKWTDSSPVNFWYISSVVYGIIGAANLQTPVNIS